MKVHILYSFKEGAWGGGNQFLKALKGCLEERGLYSSNIRTADIVLFDSFNDFHTVFKAKVRYPKKVFIHRLNGPISKYRGRDRHFDWVIFRLVKYVADGAIFQSEYSRRENLTLGMECPPLNVVIHNAPLPIFHTSEKRKSHSKITRLIATSWSSNENKGFPIYRYLDEHLDFTKFEMCFVGNSNYVFKNITYFPPMESAELAAFLKQQDIFITASKHDPCSNSVLEALASGLPVLALDSGGHRELVKNGGCLFHGEKDVIQKLNKICLNRSNLFKKIECSRIDKITEEYVRFFSKTIKEIKEPKKITGNAMIQYCSALLKYASIRFGKKFNLFNEI